MPTSQAGLPTEDAADNEAGKDELREYRIDQFMELTWKPVGREDADGNQLVQTAFTRKEASVFADAKIVEEVKVGKKAQDGTQKTQKYETPLRAGKVQTMLDQGCTPQQALRIYAGD